MAQTVCEMARHPQVIEVAGSVRVLRVCRLSVLFLSTICTYAVQYMYSTIIGVCVCESE